MPKESLKPGRGWWPSVTDKEEAKRTAQQGAGAAVFVTAVTTLLAVLAIFGVQIGARILPGFSALSLIDAGLFAIVAWRIYRMSRAWAVVGLLLYVVERVYAVSVRGSTAGIVVGVVLLLGFVNGVRGTFAYHHLEKKTREALAVSEAYAEKEKEQ